MVERQDEDTCTCTSAEKGAKNRGGAAYAWGGGIVGFYDTFYLYIIVEVRN